jgi:hypothetical protein
VATAFRTSTDLEEQGHRVRVAQRAHRVDGLGLHLEIAVPQGGHQLGQGLADPELVQGPDRFQANVAAGVGHEGGDLGEGIAHPEGTEHPAHGHP